ncbi:MAG: class I SAM-dependent methyltransferase [Acidimicrobiales bacterium]
MPESRSSDDPPPPLPEDVKAVRSGSFGAVANHYERYRPGPPEDAVAWLLPESVGTVVDLGAGTGALTRLLGAHANQVVAVEPDDRMRSVLVDEVAGVTAVDGRGEALPPEDRSVDAVLASSSWHWMDPMATLIEVHRVLIPGGVLGVLWTGPDRAGPFMERVRALLGGGADGVDGVPEAGRLRDTIGEDLQRTDYALEIPPGLPFATPEYRAFVWEMGMTADELIGLLGTLSWIITMEPTERDEVLEIARVVLRDRFGVDDDVTIDVTFRCDAFRSRTTG